MRKRSKIIKIIFIIVVCIILTILRFLYHTAFSMPPLAYDPDKLLNYKEEYTQIAELCYQDYVQSYKPYDIEYATTYMFNSERTKISAYNPPKHDISLTDEEAKALQTIDDNYLLNERNLSCIKVSDNFVVFCNARFRNSFIYSVNDEKPNFINCPSPDEKHVYIEKITDNWYYACEQYELYFVKWFI